MTGEDICSQRGPMVSPKYLRKEYFPLLEYALEPLLEIDAKIVWHCDGDVRPILDDILSCGIGGLQGFQRECGMDLNWIADLKTREGDPLLIFGPISVTKTLPFGTPEDVRAEVKIGDGTSVVIRPRWSFLPAIRSTPMYRWKISMHSGILYRKVNGNDQRTA